MVRFAFGTNKAARASTASVRTGRSSGVTSVKTCVISGRNSRGKHLYSAILIAGPTASGKSALALHLAERLGGTIINADSMQVYRALRILTARPSEAEEARVPHLLFGTVDGATNFSVGRYLAAATRALAQTRAAGRMPIFTGGTGLYLKALLHENAKALTFFPPPRWGRVRVGVDGAAARSLRIYARCGAAY